MKNENLKEVQAEEKIAMQQARELNITAVCAELKNGSDENINIENSSQNGQRIARAKERVSKLKNLDDLKEQMQNEPELNFIWKGVKEQTLNFLVAQSKVGKTTLSENLAISIAAGCDDYLGAPLWCGENNRSMIIGLEEFYRNRTTRNLLQGDYMDEKIGNNNWHVNFKSVDNTAPRYLENKKHWDWLLYEIKAFAPRLVIIDSLTRLHLGSSVEDSTVCNELSKKLRNLIDKTGCTLLVIHHTQKLLNEPLSLTNMAGSRILAQEADAIIALNKTPLGKRYIKPLAYRYADDYCDKVQCFSINKYGWLEAGQFVNESKILREFDNRTDDTNLENVREYIASYTGGDNSILIETGKMMTEFVETKIMSKPVLHKCLNILSEENFIQRHSIGTYQLLPEQAK